MNKAFEKILERLADEAIDVMLPDGFMRCCVPFLKIKSIVQEVAEEYKGGWIPCSQKLPPQPKENPVFEGKALELYMVTTKYGSNEQDKIYPFRAFWNGVNFTDGWYILDVIAWQPLPEPYKERE